MFLPRVSLLFALLTAISPSCAALRPHHKCAQCGCETVTKRCQVVCETVQVPKTTYTTEQEDVCLPEHRHCRDGHPIEGCLDHTGSETVSCGKIYTRTKLVKSTTEVPTQKYRWTIVTECPHCRSTLEGCPTEPMPPANSSPARME